MKYIKTSLLAMLLLSHSALAFTSGSTDVPIYQGDLKNYETIHGESSEDSTLYFGDSLEHFIKWDAAKNMFVFSDNVDFGGNQLVNARIENLAAAPACNSTSSGRVYLNTTNKFSYVCNGSAWKQVDEEAQNPAPYVKSVSPSNVSVGTTTAITISGGNFAIGMSVSIPNFLGSISGLTVVSPTTITLNVSPAADDTGLYDLLITDSKGNTNASAWPGNGNDVLLVETVLVPNTSGSVLWTRVSGSTTSLGQIVPSSATAAWTKGGSFGTVPASTDFRLSFQPKYMAGYTSGGSAMIGVDATDPDANYASIDYAIYMNAGSLMVYENGTYRGSFGTYADTDILGIQRNGGTLEYYKNGTKFYTSSTASSSSMVFDSSLYYLLGATNIKLVY